MSPELIWQLEPSLSSHARPQRDYTVDIVDLVGSSKSGEVGDEE